MADEIEGKLQEVERSLGTLESRMREQVAAAESSKRTTLVVGVILVILVFASLTYTTINVRREMEPKVLAETVQALAGQQIEPLKQSLLAQKEDVITGLREQAIAVVPDLRKKAEAATVDMIDANIGKLDGKVDEIITEMLKQHKGTLQPLIEAAGTKGNDEELAEAFKVSLEELVGAKMDEVLVEFNKAMDVVEAKLDRLAMEDDKLTPEELFEKEMVIMVMGFLNNVQEPTPVPPESLAVPAPAGV